jgi:hypothetical protein
VAGGSDVLTQHFYGLNARALAVMAVITVVGGRELNTTTSSVVRSAAALSFKGGLSLVSHSSH